MTEHHPDEETDRSAVDQVVDYVVFAPIGFALEARSLLPTFIDRGRAQVGVAKMVGEFAVRWGANRVESAMVDAQEQAMGLLRLTGLAPLDERPRGPEHDDTAEAPTPPGTTVRAVEPEGRTGPAEGGGEADEEGPTIDVDSLAIPDYDSLSASQVLPRLEGLEPSELDAVGHYERSRRGRNTILNRVAQLQQPDG